MANIRVRGALERISTALVRVIKHVEHYSGISAKDARLIESLADGICEGGARLAMAAKAAQGIRDPNLVKRVRKALGYSYP